MGAGWGGAGDPRRRRSGLAVNSDFRSAVSARAEGSGNIRSFRRFRISAQLRSGGLSLLLESPLAALQIAVARACGPPYAGAFGIPLTLSLKRKLLFPFGD